MNVHVWDPEYPDSLKKAADFKILYCVSRNTRANPKDDSRAAHRAMNFGLHIPSHTQWDHVFGNILYEMSFHRIERDTLFPVN
jgi:hypothetical protein